MGVSRRDLREDERLLRLFRLRPLSRLRLRLLLEEEPEDLLSLEGERDRVLVRDLFLDSLGGEIRGVVSRVSDGSRRASCSLLSSTRLFSWSDGSSSTSSDPLS